MKIMEVNDLNGIAVVADNVLTLPWDKLGPFGVCSSCNVPCASPVLLQSAHYVCRVTTISTHFLNPFFPSFHSALTTTLIATAYKAKYSRGEREHVTHSEIRPAAAYKDLFKLQVSALAHGQVSNCIHNSL